MQPRTRILIPLLLALGVAGCTVPRNRTAGGTQGDPLMYESSVQPVVERHCAFLACHGREDLPLFLFAVGFARIPPGGPGVPLDEHALSDEELIRNQLMLAARVDDRDPDKTILLRKVRAVEDGGEPHVTAEAIFERRSEPDYQDLCRWVETVTISIEGTGPVRGCAP